MSANRQFLWAVGALTWGLVFCCTQAPCRPSKKLEAKEPKIRVLIADAVSSLTLTPKVPFELRNIASDKLLAKLAANRPTTLTLSDGKLSIELYSSRDSQSTKSLALGEEAVVFAAASLDAHIGLSGLSPASREERLYEGRIEIHPEPGNRFLPVSVLRLEEYLRGVVPSEIGSNSPAQAQCAQAVAARSAALLALQNGMYASTHYDICSTVHCQAYSGLSRRTPATDAAVKATRGIILSYEGKPLPTYYSALCGGHSEDIRDVWHERGSEKAYWEPTSFDCPVSSSLDLRSEEGFRKWLDSNPDAYCNPARYKIPEWAGRNFSWTRKISAQELSGWVAKKRDIGQVRQIRAVKRGASGRVVEVEFVGEKGNYTVGPEIAIRRLFEPALRSSAFVVDPQGGTPQRPETFVLRGTGSGHGVGMCQVGAMGMASVGKNFRQILQHYYPKAKVEKLY